MSIIYTPYRHDRKNFFKYLSPSTAIKVLETSTLRWSTPELFNDPFDVVREIAPNVSEDEFQAASVRLMTSLIKNPPDDTTLFSPGIKRMLDMLKELTESEHNFFIAEFIASVDTVLPKTSKSSALEELRSMWRQFVPSLRILCLTEDPLNASMWHNYAEAHSGVVLEFNCDDPACPWNEARMVKYDEQKPDVYHADGMVRLVSLNQYEAAKKTLEVATLVKTMEWSNEKEWRIISFRRKHETEGFSDYSFNPKWLSKIYLGAKMKIHERTAVIALAKAYGNIEVHELSIGLNREFIVTKIEIPELR